MDTKTSILDAAEDLFAERGIAATSIRGIARAAGVNLAAINYHFGSKDGLIRLVFERRMKPLNEERLELLDACELRAGRKEALPLEEVLEAMMRPALRLSRDSQQGGTVFMRLLGRMFSEPELIWRNLVDQHLRETIARFIQAFKRAVPGLPPQDFFWRIHFTLGALALTLSDAQRPCELSEGACDSQDVDALVAHMIQYAAAGLRAPAVKRKAVKG